MGEKSIKRNYLYNLFYQLLMLITPLATAPYISRVLGADGVGIHSYTYSIAAYFTLVAALGTTDYGQREIAYRQDNIEKRSLMFWEVFILRLATSLLSLVAFFAITGFEKYRLIFALQSVSIISVAFDITWFFQGMEEFGKTVLRSTIVRIVNIIIIFVFVRDHNDLPIYVGSVTISALAGSLWMWLYLPKYLCRVAVRTIHPFHNFRCVIQLFIPQIAIQVSAVLDKTMLGLLSQSSFENGYYEQADRIEKLCLAVVTSLGVVMIPRISYIYAQQDKKGLEYYIYKSYRFIGFLGLPMALGLAMVASLFVPWFFGDGYERTIVLIQMLSVLLCIVGISGVTGVQYFIPTGRQREYTLSVVLGMIVNIVMNMLLIPSYLSIGAALATVAGEVTVTAVQLVFAKDSISFIKIVKLFRNYILGSAIMAISIMFGKQYLSPNIISTVCIVFIGGVTYTIVLIVLKDEIIRDILNTGFLRRFMGRWSAKR